MSQSIGPLHRVKRVGRGRLYPVLLSAYGALRLVELWVSRRHERALQAAGQPRVHERGFGILVAAHLVPFVVGPLEVRRRRRPVPRALAAGSLVALAAAGALRWWTLRTLGPSWNVRIHGGASMPVVTTGPYRYLRHPNYLAVIIEVAALPLAGGAVVTALCASVLDGIALSLRIRDEERVLRRSLAWRGTMAHKPRLIPRFPSRTRPRAQPRA